MKLLYSAIILTFCFLVQNSSAQPLHFKVIHSGHLSGIENVSVKSSTGTIYSDASGNFTLQYTNNDTLTLSKENYNTIYYLIEAKNFDSTHTINLSMSPSNTTTSSNPANLGNLQEFEYHFVHDKEPESNYLKVHALEHTPSIPSNKNNHPDFQLGSIPLERSSIEKHTTPEKDSDYSLKK